MQEIETKVLEVNVKDISSKLKKLGAKKILQTRLYVDWFRPLGIKEGFDQWFMRIRRDSKGKSELTWKSILKQSKMHRQCREINLALIDPVQMQELLLAIGLEKYAHQEKDRISWSYKKWRFDLDQYPQMPAYLEIEGNSRKHIQEASKLLGLENYKHSPEGERLLIQTQYKLDWYNMKFKK